MRRIALTLALGWCAAAVAQDAADEPIGISQAARQSQSVAEASKAPEKPHVPPAKDLPDTLKAIKESKEPAQRIEALKKLTQVQFYPVPKEVSARLFNSALLDEDADVRKESALAMKALDDREGMRFLLGGALHPKLEANIRQRAGEGLRRVDNPILVQALVTIVTEELRVGTATEVTPPQIIYITNGLNVNAALGTINLPIELPNIELRSIHTAVAFYALSALRTISQRNLGNDPAGWNRWFEDWKHIRDVRIAEEAKR